MYDLLVNEKANIVNDFLFRCYDAGKIQDVKKDILPYRKDVPGESRALLKAMVELKSLEHIDARPNVCAGLFALFVGATLISGLGSEKNAPHSCNGDCDNCPAHYGYRYGRWHYGHGHQWGCERGGDGGRRDRKSVV